MPSSISVVQCDGVPSSSMVIEPRRSGSVPSSTMVTPLAATRLAQHAGEDRGLLAVEVALEAVAHRLMQQDAGPAGSQQHVHLAGRRRPGLERDEALAQRLARGRLQTSSVK